MGLFDFIKKKLFGKTKKAEDSKKVSEKKKEFKKVSKVTKKPVRPIKKVKKDSSKSKTVDKAKEEKKGILSHIKDAILPSKKVKEEAPKPVSKSVKKSKEETTPKTKKTEKEVKKRSAPKKEVAPKEEEVVEKEEEVVEKEEEVVEKEEEVVEKEEEVVEKEEKEDEQEEVVEKEEEVVEKEEEVVEKEEEVVEKEVEEEEAIKKGLEKTKKSFFAKLKSAVLGKSKIDADVLDDLEEILITSDVGVETTVKIIDRIEERVSKDKYSSVNELNQILKEEIIKILAENSSDLDAFDVSEDAVPYVILVVGVNGVGKTTTIGKLASQFKDGGLKVLIGAADTFRAAAVDQIKMWGDRIGVDVVSHGMNTDPASVAFDTVKKAVEEKYDIVIIDTAGRLHTKLNLMNELSKIKRVVQKFKPDAPHEVMLILDGSTGQNAFVQAEEFTKATDVNSITITKLDGTAKGGVVIGITDQFKIPIKYIGVGEKVGDLKLFHKGEFVNSFFD
jgi:fused signal recognition particle receptor